MAGKRDADFTPSVQEILLGDSAGQEAAVCAGIRSDTCSLLLVRGASGINTQAPYGASKKEGGMAPSAGDSVGRKCQT